jgi:hypothetical protein
LARENPMKVVCLIRFLCWIIVWAVVIGEILGGVLTRHAAATQAGPGAAVIALASMTETLS